jgi:lysophospholipase L1-like esterase
MVKQVATSFTGLLLSKYTFSGITARKSNIMLPQADGEPVVINAGVSGNNTVNLLVRIDKDCLVHHPKLTVLMVGTNDMNSQKYVPLDKYKANLVEIITKIKAAGSQVLLMTILPWYEPYLLTRHPAAFYQPEGVAERRRQLNMAITDIAKQQSVGLLDMGRRFEALGKVGLDKDSLIQNEANTGKSDGVHPTAIGYRFIALAVYDYIVDNRLPTSGIVCFGDSITKGQGAPDDESYPACLLKLLTGRE